MVNTMKSKKLFVVKRDGRKEEVHFDKITSRIQKLCYGLNMDFVDPVAITLRVINGLYCGVTTQQLDNLAAETAATLTTDHADYALLAARIAVSNLHKETKKVFSDVISDLRNYISTETDQPSSMISEFHYNVVMKNSDRLNSAIVYDRDFGYNYFGFKTLERSYLLKMNGKIVERPQHMLMRVAVGIHGEDIDSAIETYNLLSERFFTHASPTLFAAATNRPQLSSCFLLTMVADSIEGIFKSVEQCAMISKSAGGIGINVHCIRAKGTSIAGTNGTSNGLVPMLRVFNNVARYVDQGGGKRPGAFAIYLEPWHSDVFEFLDLKKNTGKEEHRARDLFYALWIPDLFMRRVEMNGDWSLMCPHKCPGLHDVWGEEFDKLYEKYEKEGKANRTVKAQALWFAIIEAQVETGTPYMLFKDACNRKSNQQNVGTIKCSNLCTEIVEYSAPDEIAVCNLASIALNMFVTPEKTFDFEKLKSVSKVVARNLNKIIDINYYPLPEAKKSNLRHRPIGIGVQGLADTFILMRYPYESEEALLLNQQIFETIYYGALESSCELAEELGPYDTYEGCPVSKGILQYDMWDKTPTTLWDWAALKERIAKHGVRNSLLIAPMPTASTAQIMGNNEAFEPYTSNIYTRRVLSGEFNVVNHHLLKDLTELDLWDEDMKNKIISSRGSIQNIDAIPKEIRDLYKTVWEISVKTTIKMAADRGAFIDQSQSFNIHVAEPNYGKLTSIHFYSWKAGLKTGMYYLRTKPAANAIQFTVSRNRETQVPEVTAKTNGEKENGAASPNGSAAEREKHMAEMDPDAEGYIDVDNTVLTPSPHRVRNILTLDERVDAIKAYQQRPMYTKVARMFNCSWEQIKNIILNREAIMEFYEATKSQRDFNTKDDGVEMDQTQQKIKYLGECVYEYIQRVQFYQKKPITEEMIRIKVMEFQDIIKLDGFVPNKAWINHFKAIYNISLSNKQIVLTRVPPASLDLKDIMTYCTKYRGPGATLNSVHMKDLKQKYNSFDAKTAEYESRRVRKLNFLQRALNEYLHRAKFHHKTLNLDDESVQKVAESFNDILKVQDFFPSLAWISRFKHRHNVEEIENSSSSKEKNSKKPLLSLDLKDILSYCGRMDNKSGACTVTLTPKHGGGQPPSYAHIPKYHSANDSYLKFQQNPIIYLDDNDEKSRDIKPDVEELKIKRPQKMEQPPPPLKIRKIESINNDPVLHRQLQQQQQQEQQQQLEDENQERVQQQMQEPAKDEKIYIKHEIYIKNEKEDQTEELDLPTPIALTSAALTARHQGSNNNNSSAGSTIIPNVIIDEPASTQRLIKSNTSPAVNSPVKCHHIRSSRDSTWQVTNFDDALRFLKPLEEYAMLAENYRAIGLISQLEEVLKQQSLSKSSTNDFNS